ncbi:hypothetical protein DVH24_032889 [Malus domestica]|uniref:Uncharacterized protein n=1 Tax=Malus domestica TaxID=3750 RepID=A0A498IR37_MALDO|nr:hypothetical protein DVH24_032889 [Malus domestica]
MNLIDSLHENLVATVDVCTFFLIKSENWIFRRYVDIMCPVIFSLRLGSVSACFSSEWFGERIVLSLFSAFSDRSHVFDRYTLGLVTPFRGFNLNNHCSWCHYLSCVPTSKWNCKSQNIYCLIICCTFLRILTSSLIFDRQKCLLINMIMVAFSRSSLACRLV